MKIMLLGAVAVAASVASSASAQTVDPLFTGARIEARVGWDRPTIRAGVSDGVDSINRTAGKDGVVYGGEIGYDYALSNVLVGGYFGYEGSSAKECGELYGQDQLCLRAGRNFTAGARLGVPVSGSFALYAKGGYSNGRAKLDYRDDTLVRADVDEGRNFNGFHVGGGVEGTLSGRVYGRLEYVYTGYGEKSAVSDGLRASIEPRRHQVVYGMGIRF
ncbi:MULTISPECIES: outer membrane protein [Sphingomonas]|uniref:Outer membrane beta-barrel protein n=1 Tax=Sphingomonas kyungheensis TaxID=1069987 RepID=A0ABU8GZK8_9SPHN|nr:MULTISPECIES: outer membrane beta-barrel protein [unclassified Sphingomonas]EZP52641.1 Opacity protein antigens-like protein [Sphingomonas sp. RIT328]